MFKILKEMWLNIGLEKIDTHEGIIVKVLLDNSVTGMFMDRKTAARHGFKLQNVRATGHKTPGESSENITISVYDTTHLQENPQRIG